MSDGLVNVWRDTAGLRAAEPRLGRRRAVTAATSTVASMKILQLAPALHGAKMQTSRGTHSGGEALSTRCRGAVGLISAAWRPWSAVVDRSG
jgi:hypothetical protein